MNRDAVNSYKHLGGRKVQEWEVFVRLDLAEILQNGVHHLEGLINFLLQVSQG